MGSLEGIMGDAGNQSPLKGAYGAHGVCGFRV